MYKSIIPIFLLLIFFCSCSGKSEQAADLINKANALLSEKEFNEQQKAIDYLTEAVKLQPDNHEIYNMRGCIYMTTGKNQLAYDDFNKANRFFIYKFKKASEAGVGWDAMLQQHPV